jgi:hypothetical protein
MTADFYPIETSVSTEFGGNRRLSVNAVGLTSHTQVQNPLKVSTAFAIVPR